jgi:hypothetical protein
MHLPESNRVAIAGSLKQLAGRIAVVQRIDDEAGAGVVDVLLEFLANEVLDWVRRAQRGQVSGERNAFALG